MVAVVHLLLEAPQPRDDEDEAEDLEADVGGEHADVAAGVEEEGSEGQRRQVGQVVKEGKHGHPHKPGPELEHIHIYSHYISNKYHIQYFKHCFLKNRLNVFLIQTS